MRDKEVPCCDSCGRSADEYATLSARWERSDDHQGERYALRLCERCFFCVVQGIEHQRFLETMFDDEPYRRGAIEERARQPATKQVGELRTHRDDIACVHGLSKVLPPLKPPRNMLEGLSVEGLSYDASARYLVTLRYREEGACCTDKFLVWNFKGLLKTLAEYDEIP